jgi:hypothetical protein
MNLIKILIHLDFKFVQNVNFLTCKKIRILKCINMKVCENIDDFIGLFEFFFSD